MTISEVAAKYQISQDTLRYYEKVGVIPPVARTKGGVRDYNDEDLGWVENAICMRSAGVSVETMIEYVRLYMEGASTFGERRDLLAEEKKKLLIQFETLKNTIDKLSYKISVYEEAMETGELIWEDGCCPSQRKE